jgi:hypothetical protein
VSRRNKITIWAAVIAASGAIIAAVITGFMKESGGVKVDQKTGRDGQVCVGTCR